MLVDIPADALEVVAEKVGQTVVPVGHRPDLAGLLVLAQLLDAPPQIHQRIVDLA